MPIERSEALRKEEGWLTGAYYCFGAVEALEKLVTHDDHADVHVSDVKALIDYYHSIWKQHNMRYGVDPGE